ncbi:MAG: hypothetical protein RXQ77_02475 [Candidatus Nanopusillus sp.]
MNIQKTKQNLSNLRVKAILASYIIIIGEDTNKNKDIIVFIPNKELFEKIILGEDYELNKEYLHEIIGMQKLDFYGKKRIERIFNIIDSDPKIPEEIPEQNLNIIKEFIITKITLQQLENNTFLNKQIRKIIQNERPIIYIRLYIYLAGFEDLANILKIKGKEDVDILFKVLLKSYEILRELNPDQSKKVNEIVYRLKSILESPEKIDLKIDISILGLIRIPIQLRDLYKEKRKSESDLNIIKEKLETKLALETEPEEFENDPEAKELKERKKEIEKQLEEIENKIKELRKEWERLRSNKEN